MRWSWLDRGLSGWLTTLFQWFDTVGWVIRPVKNRRTGLMLYCITVGRTSTSRQQGVLSMWWVANECWCHCVSDDCSCDQQGQCVWKGWLSEFVIDEWLHTAVLSRCSCRIMSSWTKVIRSRTQRTNVPKESTRYVRAIASCCQAHPSWTTSRCLAL